MKLADELASESIRQLLSAMQSLPDDAKPADRIKLVSEASRLLERTESKVTVVRRLGEKQEEV